MKKSFLNFLNFTESGRVFYEAGASLTDGASGTRPARTEAERRPMRQMEIQASHLAKYNPVSTLKRIPKHVPSFGYGGQAQ